MAGSRLDRDIAEHLAEDAGLSVQEFQDETGVEVDDNDVRSDDVAHLGVTMTPPD